MNGNNIPINTIDDTWKTVKANNRSNVNNKVNNRRFNSIDVSNKYTVRITAWDPSRKVNHLSKVVRKIITEFTRSISSTRIGKPVLMMDIKVSKDKNISRWVDQENLIYVRCNRVKNHA